MISSLLAWDATPRNLEEIRSPEDVEEEERLAAEEAAKIKAEALAAKRAAQAALEEAEAAEGAEGAEGEEVKSPEAVAEEAPKVDGEEAPKAEGEGEATIESKVEEAEIVQSEEEEEKEDEAPAKRKRKRYLHHPFTESDFRKRKASAEYAKIKEVEDLVLNFKKEGVKTYVISAGVLYGFGEAIFNHHFERAWKQDPTKLPIIGEGKNSVPTIHVRDLARMVRKIFEAPPESKYIFGIDNTKKPTQAKLI